MRVLLVTPPMTQLNTPYPATAYLTGFLRSRGIDAHQVDLALALVLRLFSARGLAQVAEACEALPRRGRSPAVRHFLAHRGAYLATVGPVLRFLQGQDPTLAHRIASGALLPEGPRFGSLDAYEGDDPLGWAFGSLGLGDRAKHLASLYMDDLADVIRDGVDARFAFVRYAESLAESQPTFDPLAEALEGEGSLVDRLLAEVTREALATHAPDVLGVTAPFAGNVYGAFRVAREARGIPRILGGGFVNTELRELSDPRVFEYFDYVTLDDGERPLLCLLEHLRGERPRDRLFRTFVREGGEVRLVSDPAERDVPFAEVGTPTWDGLPLAGYPSVLELLNPMHRLWSDGRWNKLTVAHGCYWKKCSFCDVSLDYIARYDAAPARRVVDRMEAAIAETGCTGFHLVDEAAPPRSLRAMAEEILARGLVVTWWGNIRFERSFTPELCALLARSGCVAVTGGLEVASDRLLTLMQKGVTIEQVARVTRAFGEAGVLVHAYLMYGFATQTVQETVDALEVVRQLFAEGCLQSAFWHRLGVTAHSPIGLEPERFGVRVVPQEEPVRRFARNELVFLDPAGVDHEALGRGLSKAVYNFMHGVGLDADVRSWFEADVPSTTIPAERIAAALAEPKDRGVARGRHPV